MGSFLCPECKEYYPIIQGRYASVPPWPGRPIGFYCNRCWREFYKYIKEEENKDGQAHTH